MRNIVVLDGHTLNPGDNPWDDLSELGDLKVYERTDANEFAGRAHDAEVLIVNKFRLGPLEMDGVPNLRFVAVTATGYDCVDISAASERGIVVSNVPIYGTDSVAQYIIAMLLHICHRIDIHDTAIRDGYWEECQDFSFWKVPLVELVGMKMGVIGFGRIGRRVGRLANAFGMQILANSPRQFNTPSYDPFRWVDLDTLAAKADVISINCPLNEGTNGMINREFLAKCKSNLILLNASRGAVINEQDVADALNTGQIAAAGFDVASVEPIERTNPLLTAKNCFLTPHLAWATLSARRRLMKKTVDNVASFLRGQPQNVVS